MEPRKTFVMSIEFWAGAKVLDAPQKAVLLQAIMAFNGADCEMPEMDQATAGVFGMMEPFFNASRAHYDDVCNKRREAGRKGGLSGKAKKAKASKITSRIFRTFFWGSPGQVLLCLKSGHHGRLSRTHGPDVYLGFW